MNFFKRKEPVDILAQIDIFADEAHTSETTENIVAASDITDNPEQSVTNKHTQVQENFKDIVSQAQQTIEEIQKNPAEEKNVSKKIPATIKFVIKYIITTTSIFFWLMLIANYNAYYNVVYSYVFAWELQNKESQIISSLQSANIEKSTADIKKIQDSTKYTQKEDIEIQYKKNIADIKPDNDNLSLDIDIAPFENRLIIPKIGKNIPLLDVQNDTVSDVTELHNVFMKDLEKGVIRYPGSAKPGWRGNSFIFGHSSNYAWAKWDYNDVFALLGNLEAGDEIISYYGQKKYTYKVTEKSVIKPGEVEALEAGNGKKRITLMTCWPIGTTLNRLIVLWELVEEDI